MCSRRLKREMLDASDAFEFERAASLRIRPPPGFVILGVRVAGERAALRAWAISAKYYL